MDYGLELTAGPVVEPVTATEAKLHARIDLTTEDDLVDDWITAAREYAEIHCARAFAAQTWKLTLPRWSQIIRLPVDPVISVTSVKYYDVAGVQQTLTAVTDYQLWLSHSPSLIAPAPATSWPSLQTDRFDPIEIIFVAGTTDIPVRVKQAIYLMVTYWSENRGDGKDMSDRGMPAGARRLLDSMWSGRY